MARTIFERAKPSDAVIDASLAGTRNVPFWIDDVGPITPGVPLTGEHSADLVVVGAGYCGLWTALLAKQEDPARRVMVLESHTVGWAASGRNGGFVDASLTHGHDNGASRFPDEIDRLDEQGLQNLDEIEKTVADLGLDCDFERTGAIDVAIEPHQVQWLREAADGTESVFLDADAVRAEVNSPTYLAGLWHKTGTAMVHPAKLARELARACREAGVEIFENSAATSLDSDRRDADAVPGTRSTGAVVVHTDRGRVRAGQVALATNVFPSLLKRNRLYTVPVYDYVLMTEPLTDEQLASIGWQGRAGLSDVANQFHYYRISADNRILWGGYDALYNFGRTVRSEYEDRPETFRKLAGHFFTTFPQLEGVRFSHRWAGAIDTSTRFCAFYGTARGGRVAYAAGFTGLGVGATRFAAQVMLDQLAGRDTERTRLKMVRSKPLPFPPEPFASAGIQATRWSLDRADHNGGKRNLFLKTLDAVGLGFDS
ncbi:NAD(P)/FAD-dependent oxidoreductase [Specibacter cremeus]|uniref:NAD(P)/FAD-dependent oxidoreductase n=1 Tax=Specibacter cremeus TaxID=1629051 RepID=UPI000F78F013|nr:FAD-binding oxidoreductase [Specibacter cremeus]